MIRKHIPNTITCLSIASGSVASYIALVYPNFLYFASFLVIASAVFDFLDGFFARLLKAYSPMGKELDSLADMVSFGFAPSAIMFSIFRVHLGVGSGNLEEIVLEDALFLFSPLIIVVFSGIRLAKFNVDTRQSESFIGMPTPANALFFISLPLILAFHKESFAEQVILNKWVLVGFIFFQSFLIVSELPMFSLKMKNLNFKGNEKQYLLFALSVFSIIIFKFIAIPLSIFAYLLLSVFSLFFVKNK